MVDRWLLAAGQVALAGAATMLMHPDVPVGVMGGSGRVLGSLFVLLAWGGAALVVASGRPRTDLAGAVAVTVALLAAVPFLVLVPDWAGQSYLATVLGALAATHLALAPAAARLTESDAGLVRRAAVASGAVHAGLLLGVLPTLMEQGHAGAYLPGVLLGALFFGLLAWGLGSAGSLYAAPAATQDDDRRVRAGLLLGAAVVLLGLGLLFPPRAAMLWAMFLLLVATVLAAGVWTWSRPAP